VHNKYIKVEGNSDLVRDADTMAILNTNRTDYDNYLRKRDSILSDKQQIQVQAEEINNLKEDLSEIKQMLIALLKDRIKDK
jgi:hypothetical protein